MQTMSSQRMLTPAEVAVRLSVSRPTVYRLLEAGEIPGVRVGGQYRTDQDALEAWIAEGR
jgi:excisionase family DNA binding protein